MSSFTELRAAHRRLTILQLLERTAGYAANEDLLQSALEAVGHTVGIDRLRTDIAWLAEQDLVHADTVADMRIAKLTQRGADVAAGRTTVPGVKRPAPGDAT